MQFKNSVFGIHGNLFCFYIGVDPFCLRNGSCFGILIGFILLSFQVLVEKMGLPEGSRDYKSTSGREILRMLNHDILSFFFLSLTFPWY